MEVWVALTTFFSFLSGYSALFESAEFTAKSAKGLRAKLKEHWRDVDFVALYDEGHVRFVKKQARRLGVLSDEDVEVALLLAGALFFRYHTGAAFREIRVAGATSPLQPLPMDRYYTDLSYIPQRDLQRRESLLRREKSPAGARRERAGGPLRLQTALSHDYLSGSVLATSDRVILSGNPGVGKSTYACWLCHQWSKGAVPVEGLLVHVTLRDLRFGAGNALVEYVNETYLAGQTAYADSVHRLLTVRNDEFVFVLDGFDELTDEEQRRLQTDLDALSDTARFVLLSRPYGLLNHRLPHDAAFQIDGFNEAAIVRYVTDLLAANPAPGRSPEALLDVVQANRVLSDYAHTPLMLSFIVLVYLTSDRPEERLGAVDSVYALQQEVLGWLVGHARSKRPDVRELREPPESGRELAAEMELGQAVVYRARGPFDSHEPAARLLSVIGVGSQKAVGEGAGWSFAFSSVTFQEMLAAEHLAPAVSAEAFLYLVKDRFFWNFAKFLVGRLSSEREDAVVDEVGAALRAAYEESGRAFYLYTDVMLLSETRREYLRRRITTRELEALVETYRQAYFDDYWPQLLLEAIGRIHSKLDLAGREAVRDLICDRIDAITREMPATLATAEHLFYVLGLAEATDLHADPVLVEVLLRTLIALADAAREYEIEGERIEEALGEDAYGDSAYEEANDHHMGALNTMALLHHMLLEVPPALVASNRSLVEALRSKRLDAFLSNEAMLVASVTPLEELLDRARARLGEAERLLRSPEPIEEVDVWERERADTVVDAASLFFAVATAGGQALDDSTGERNGSLTEDVRVFVGSAHEALFEMLQQVEIDSLAGNEAYEMIVTGLNQIRDPGLYDDLFRAAEHHGGRLRFEIKDEAAFRGYIEQLLGENEDGATPDGAFDRDRLGRLIAALEHTTNGRFAYADYRRRLTDLLHDWLIVHAEPLAEVQRFRDRTWPDALEVAEMADAEEAAVRADALAALPVFDFDVKYVLDRLLESDIRENPYVRGTLIPRLLGDDDFAFYQQRYWHFVLDLAGDPARAPEVVEVLDSSGVYLYAANLSYVRDVLERVVPHLRAWPTEIRRSEAYSLINIAGQALKALKQAGEHDPGLVEQTGELLAFAEVREAFRSGVIAETLGPEQGLAYVLQLYFSRDGAFDLGLDYEAFTEGYPALRASMVKLFVELFGREGTIPLHELRRREAVLGPAFTKRIAEHVDAFSILRHRYRREVFEELLERPA